MQGERRVKRQGGAAALARPHQHPLGRAAGAGRERHDLDAAGAALEGGEDGAEPRGAVDQRQPPAGRQPPEARRRSSRGAPASPSRWAASRPGRRRRSRSAGWNGGLARTWSKLSARSAVGRAAQVALVHDERQAVAGGVAPGEGGVVRLQLEAVQLEPADPGGEAERGDTGAAAELEHARPPAGPARRRRAAAGRWRRGSRCAAARAAAGRRGRRRRSARRRRRRHSGSRPSTSLSRRTARARKASRSATVEPARQHADRALEHARMDVQNEAVYTLAPQQRGAEGDDRGVVAAQDLPHGAQPSDGTGRGRELMSSTARLANPVDDLQAALADDMGRGQRADPRADGERARAAHPGGDRAPGRGRRQAAAAAADARCGAALRLRRRAPPAARGDGRVHPHRDAAARRRRRREPAAARAADGQPALGQQVERAGRRLSVRPRLPADGRDRVAAGARHPRQRLGGDRRGRGAAADGGREPRDRRGDLPQGGARQDRGAVRRAPARSAG